MPLTYAPSRPAWVIPHGGEAHPKRVMTATKAWCDGALEQRTELLETAQRSRQRGDWQMTQASGVPVGTACGGAQRLGHEARGPEVAAV